MKTSEEIQEILKSHFGTTAYYEWSPFKGYPVITDGVLALADAAECYWLLDIIGAYQSNEKLDKNFQVWKLTKHKDESALVRGFNDTTLIVAQGISYTDFPLNSLELWLENGVILLPTEH